MLVHLHVIVCHRYKLLHVSLKAKLKIPWPPKDMIVLVQSCINFVYNLKAINHAMTKDRKYPRKKSYTYLCF